MNGNKGIPALLGLALLLAVTVSANPGRAIAAVDPRMVVEIVANDEGQLPSIQQAIQQALPKLWDRIMASADRSDVSDRVRATPFLLRVLPTPDRIQVIFNQERVWQYLDEHHVEWLKTPPRINLQIRMINALGEEMDQTVAALEEYAAKVANDYGMTIDPMAPPLTARWQWLSNSEIELVTEGAMADPYAAPVRRTMVAEESLDALQHWVKEIMLNYRSHAGQQQDVNSVLNAAIQHAAGLELILTIRQQAGLSAQVALEDALSQDKRVKSMVPVFLSSKSRRYRITLLGDDDAWLHEWFRLRGMQLTTTPEGWIAQ